MPTRNGVTGKLATYRGKRDFTRTAEPRGRAVRRRPGRLRFVIQKHAASHLHFDLRLELDGVMKSWAVPKGPSLDPTLKRLAVQVEDHPIEYNSFEGLIPEGEYGGGTVMLWDRGTYTVDGAEPATETAAMRREYARGKVEITFHGDRLRGAFTLVRKHGDDEAKPQWLLIKRADDMAAPDRDLASEVRTSVASGRTMEEIANGDSRVWNSNRASNDGRRDRKGRRSSVREQRPTTDRTLRGATSNHLTLPASLSPMLATLVREPPTGAGWVYEPKYDGIRILGAAAGGSIALLSRNGNAKTAQFPEVVDALRTLAQRRARSFVLDGEIVALAHDAPARFQTLQARTHLTDSEEITARTRATPVAYIIFDLLLEGDDVLLAEPWHVRRKRLLQLLLPPVPHVLRVSETHEGDAHALIARARAAGWEGVIAKRRDSSYQPGKRSRDWLKLKVEHQQEFVVGGYTEPRASRQYLGAILLGYHDAEGQLVYAGHTGGGFSQDSLREMHRKLAPLERKTSPFAGRPPRTNERAHWVAPKIVVEVKFNEWTADGKLRQPIFLGIRDDKPAREVRREDPTTSADAPARRSRAPARTRATARATRATRIIAAIEHLIAGGGEGLLDLGPRRALEVSNLDKVFFPRTGHTKGDVMRYYAAIAPTLLPAIADRPLVMKRFPNGVEGQAFYQQKAPADAPPIVRVETVADEGITTQKRVIGGDLSTLLYLVQLGAISVDPWHSRVKSIGFADYAIIDLDPGPRAKFQRVVQVARWVGEELDALGLHAVPKTSGASGIHIVLPLPPKVTNQQSRELAELVATRVAEKHPRETTLQRWVNARSPAAVYVDYLQNIRGKTVASVYSVRAQPAPTVSTPLRWEELTDGLDPRAFTIDTMARRLADVGDLWATGMRRKNTIRKLVAHGIAS